MPILSLFADVATLSQDPLTGWTGLLLQSGAFGLLFYVVVFLAPRILKEAKEERESRDRLFSAILDNLQSKFEVRNDKVLEGLKDQTKSLTEAMTRICQASLFIPHRRGGSGQ